MNLQREPAEPPAVLYHGTAARNQAMIWRDGLRKMGRHYVYLSVDVDAARMVGARYGAPVIFGLNAAAMHTNGHVFYRSANGVWLTDEVPPRYLRSEV